ncbi:unnamed protein product [Cylindrotheca closterium]|uniref:Uncharacterized protein n=1 Tax=Cylindrotheca closterium TaxID=2856 RepID=A0AAD2GA82_9STRA|nr:unnamed protein product [Cylindrotheca closterium]
MHTNVGSRVLDKEGFLGRFPPPVYHDEDGIANVLAMREMIAAGYRITMDTDADNAFIVHCDGNQKMQFVNRKGVYVLEQLGIKKMLIEEPMVLGALLLIWRIYKNRQKKRLYLSLKCLK